MAKTTKTKTEEKVVTKVEKEQVVVTFGGKTREYSLSVHGKDFLKLAEEFAAKYTGSTIE